MYEMYIFNKLIDLGKNVQKLKHTVSSKVAMPSKCPSSVTSHCLSVCENKGSLVCVCVYTSHKICKSECGNKD